MQQFQDYDNEGFNVARCLFDVVQNSKIRFTTCSEVFLFGINFSDSSSAVNWASPSIENNPTLALPETFKEHQKISFEQSYQFAYVVR